MDALSLASFCGGAWRYEAKRNVANYIRAELEDQKDLFTVID